MIIKKSIGRQPVWLTRKINSSLTTDEQQKYIDLTGWEQLDLNLSQRPGDEVLISLYMQNSKTTHAATYYFDINAQELLGQVVIKGQPF